MKLSGGKLCCGTILQKPKAVYFFVSAINELQSCPNTVYCAVESTQVTLRKKFLMTMLAFSLCILPNRKLPL